MSGICEVHVLGLIEYERAWKLQNRLAAEIAAGSRLPTLLLLEHPHTYTFGRSGHAENLLLNPEALEQRGVAVHWVDRGGDVTYHGPGQLVGYPLIPLGVPESGSGRIPKADYVGYVRKLEGTLICALERFGIHGLRIEGLTGVWVQTGPNRAPEKIAAIGVKVDVYGISRHGFALNIDTDRTYWNGIIGCGLKDHNITSMAEHMDKAPAMEEVIEAVSAAFGREFDYELQFAEGQDLFQEG